LRPMAAMCRPNVPHFPSEGSPSYMDGGISGGAPVSAYTINECCRAHRLGRSTFYKLLREGSAPRIVHVGKKVLIPADAAAEWLRQRAATEPQQPARGLSAKQRKRQKAARDAAIEQVRACELLAAAGP